MDLSKPYQAQYTHHGFSSAKTYLSLASPGPALCE